MQFFVHAIAVLQPRCGANTEIFTTLSYLTMPGHCCAFNCSLRTEIQLPSHRLYKRRELNITDLPLHTTWHVAAPQHDDRTWLQWRHFT